MQIPQFLAISGLAIVLLDAQASRQKIVDVEVVGHVLKPVPAEAPNRLTVPDGFTVARFAQALGKPRMLAVAADGSVYVTRREPGDCVLLRDRNDDGKADDVTVVAKKSGLHGIAIHHDRIYFATVKEVFVADRMADGSVGELKPIITDLPDGGQHPNRTLGVGPDGRLYISVGSTCNACTETNRESAAMLRTRLDGSEREVLASGLRNTIGFAWHPGTKELWGWDHGIDWLGDDQQGEEFNLLVHGARYGWPYVFAKSRQNPADEPPGGISREEWTRMSREPVLLYTAHAAPMQMLFYTGDQFPEEYRNDVFVAMHGSWNRKPPSGYEVVRVRFKNNKPVQVEPFLSGFLGQERGRWTHSGRPTGLAIAADGALLVSDDALGAIYRISCPRRSSTRN
jgi:glucose/arabinose dehydrogenase